MNKLVRKSCRPAEGGRKRWASRADLQGLVLDKLSEVLDKEQKLNKFRNLLYAMSQRDKTIVKTGGKQKGRWALAEGGEDRVLDKRAAF